MVEVNLLKANLIKGEGKKVKEIESVFLCFFCKMNIEKCRESIRITNKHTKENKANLNIQHSPFFISPFPT